MGSVVREKENGSGEGYGEGERREGRRGVCCEGKVEREGVEEGKGMRKTGNATWVLVRSGE